MASQKSQNSNMLLAFLTLLGVIAHRCSCRFLHAPQRSGNHTGTG